MTEGTGVSGTSRPLNWAIVGTGFISSTVIEAIATSDGSRVELVVGRSEERLAELCGTHGIARSTTDLGTALADPAVDVVYIGLPNHMHHEVTIAAARAGKAVLSEKSLTTTMAEANQLVDGVRAAGTFFVEGLMYLAHPLYRTVEAVLADGRLGTIRSVRGSYAAHIAHLVNPAGKGTLYNLGCYPVSLLQWVMQTTFGEAAFADRTMAAVGNRSAAGDSAAGNPAAENLLDAAVAVRFGNGVLATLHSTDSFGIGSEFAISGDNGVLRFETNPWLPDRYSELTWLPFDGEPETIVVEDDNDAFHHQTKLVERCLAAGLTEAPRPSPRLADSLEIMAFLTEWEAGC